MAKPKDDPTGTKGPGGSEQAGDPHDPVSRFAPHLREEFETLRRSEDQIMKSLEDPAIAARFAADPARTLEQIGVNVPAAIKSRLRANAQPPARVEEPDEGDGGQVVTANVKVRFTRGKEG